MLSGHSDRCLLWWKCPEFYLTVLGIVIRYVKAHLNVLNIRWTRTWKHMASICVVVLVCVLMSISFWPTWRLAVTSRACQPITHLLLFTREDTLKICRLSMSLRMMQSGCNYLKWVLSQHLTKQFRMFAQGTFFKELFKEKYWRFYPSAIRKKIQYGNCV